MEKINSINLNSINEKVFTKALVFCLFLAISILAPFIKIQLVTGSIVNSILFLAVTILGLKAGILIGFMPSLASAFVGLLPVALLPMVPYIIIANGILVFTFWLFIKKNIWIGFLTASVLKFLFLSISAYLLINFFIEGVLPPPIIAMMVWPQLITALSGSLIALCALKILKKLNLFSI